MAQIPLYPRRGTTYLDANGATITSAGRYCEESAYIDDAILRGDLQTVDPLDVYLPDPASTSNGTGGAPIGANYLVTALDGTLTHEKVLTAGANNTLTETANALTIASTGGGGGAPTTAQYVTLASDATLTNESVLTAGTGITVVQGAGTVTINATGTGGAPVGASYLTLATDGTLTSERVLTAGANITLTDGGAGGTLTIAATGTGAPVGASYVTLASDATLTNEKVLTAGAGITLTPAAGTVTISTSATGANPNDSYLTWGVNADLPSSRVVGAGGGFVADLTTPGVMGFSIPGVMAMTSVVMSTPTVGPAPPNTRALTAGAGINITDGGAGSTVTIAATGAAPVGAQYLTLASDSTLTSERVLTAGTNIAFVDGGAGGTLTINATGGSGGTSGFLNVLDNGVVQGTLPNSTARTNNRTAFNLAIVAARTAKKMLIVPPGRYEIDGGALLISDYDRWHGSVNTFIVQYKLNAPVMHVGAALGTANTPVSWVVIDGCQLMYAGTGTSGANALEINGAWRCQFMNIGIGDVDAPYSSRTSVPYCGIYFDPAAGTLPPFSNVFTNICVKMFVWRGISMSRDLTGSDGEYTQNIFNDIYISGGSGHGAGTNQQDISSVSGSSMFSASGHSELVLNGVNFEWCTTPTCMDFNAMNGVHINGCHIEGIELKNASTDRGSFLSLYNSKVHVTSTTVYDCYAKNASNIDTAAIFTLGVNTRLSWNNLRIKAIDRTGTTLTLIRSFSYSGQDDVHVAAGTANIDASAIDGYDAFTFATAGQSLYGLLNDFNNNTPVTLADAAQTHYAYCSPGFLLFPTMAANRTLTLSPYLRSADSIRIPQGTHRKIRKTNATNTLTIANGGAGGGTVALTTVGTYEFWFDGTNWTQLV